MSFEVPEDAPHDSYRGDVHGVIASHESSPTERERAAECVWFAYYGARGGGGGRDGTGRGAEGRPVREDVIPAPNPISMDVEHLETVRSKDYVVALKADGVRYHIVLLQINARPTAVLVSRTCKALTATYVRGPSRLFRNEGTVIDAELVGNTLHMFDIVMTGGNRAISKADYLARLAEIAGINLEIGFGSRTLIEAKLKPVYPSRQAFKLLEAQGESSASDGLVFTPLRAPIRTWTHWEMFKMKQHHTIDLKLVLVPVKNHYAVPQEMIRQVNSQLLRQMITKETRVNQTKVGSVLTADQTKQRRTLLDMVKSGTRKRTRPEPPTGIAQPPPTEPPKPTAATSDSGSAPPPKPAIVWAPRLEYMNGSDEVDATTKGIEFMGKVIKFRIKEDKYFTSLLDAMERMWCQMQSTQTSEGNIVFLHIIVECRLFLNEKWDDPIMWVAIDRTRPDKKEPNNLITVTRTLTSLMNGVTLADLQVLGEEPVGDSLV